MRRDRIVGSVVLALAAVCLSSRSSAQRPEIRRDYLDTTVRACTDFYSFANGAWSRVTAIPETERWVGTIGDAINHADSVLNGILSDAATRYRRSSDPTTQRLGAFYASCMDSTRANREGLAPIRPELDRIACMTSRADISRELAHLQLRWVQAGFGPMPSFASPSARAWAYADMKNSSRNILWLYQGGVALPEAGSYTGLDSASRAMRVGYQNHVARMLTLAGTPEPQAKTDAATVLAIETKLAEEFLTTEEFSVPAKVYEPTSVDELATMVPAIDWPTYFAELGVPTLAGNTILSVSPSKFFRRLNEQLTQRPLADWKAYLRWELLHSVGSDLGSAAEAESFRLETLISGATKAAPRAKRCTEEADALMGMAIGKIYVERAFSPAAKKRIEQLVANLRAVLHDRIAANDWMGAATKAEALKKVDVLRVEVAYPQTWVDYAAVPISSDKPFVENVMLLRRFEDQRHLAKLDRPVDRGEWEMSPATVNAYENPQFNALFFPAAILQPPWFSFDADDAMNYGGVGWVIGHELTHFFDDQGRQFDANGNLRDWWLPEDAKRYQDRAAVVRRQYDSYVAIDTLHVNGSQTLNENTADIGGLTIAYYAFQHALASQPQPNRVSGYSPDQEFFLNAAQSSRFKARPELMRLAVAGDSHSPAYWRVNGSVSSLPEFAASFSCREGDPMARPPESRARLW
jgi:putative endopeptidase